MNRTMTAATARREFLQTGIVLAACGPALLTSSARAAMGPNDKFDLHAHSYPFGSAIGIPADELVAHQRTTTVVSAGGAGANNFAALRRSSVPSRPVNCPACPTCPG